MLLHVADTQGVGVIHFRHVSLRDLGTVSMKRLSGSCESWMEFWREGEPGRSCGLEGHLLRDLDKGFRRHEKKGKNRERREGEPSFLRAAKETGME